MNHQISIYETCQRCYDITQRYMNLTDSTDIIKETKDKLQLCIDTFTETILERWTPFVDDDNFQKHYLSISYNGGKDCQVLMIIYLASIYKKYQDQLYNNKTRIPAVYLQTYTNFPELMQFIEDSKRLYSLDLYVTNTNVMVSTLNEYLNSRRSRHNENIGILLGTRQTDAIDYKMETIQPTDKNYPKFIRIQPILSWTLKNVWSFLLFSKEPYCSLYDKGYTSLGQPSKTMPNPWLINTPTNPNRKHANLFGNERDNEEDYSNCQYLPGWYMIDDMKERDGRN
ncbi:hypothetical protein ACO0R3_000149 [Hanseniaspora guilliermondii]